MNIDHLRLVKIDITLNWQKKIIGVCKDPSILINMFKNTGIFYGAWKLKNILMGFCK